jgi:hypothetical protein
MIPRTRDALSQLLRRTFPHTQDIAPETLDAFIDGLMKVKAGAAESGAAPREHTGEHGLYVLRATHARRTPVTSVFTGITHSIRVRLPDAEPTPIHTPIGLVSPDDHLLPTQAAVRERFGDRLGSFERVDLITPVRHGPSRFAPMSLYLGYAREHDERPSFIIYEPGDALGNPGALYCGETLETVIEEPAGYKPTPLSSPDHWYTGGIKMADNGCDPAVLYMSASHERGGEPHFRLHCEYEVSDTLPEVMPIRDLVEAAMRMLAVLDGTGEDLGVVERLVAETGLLVYDWVDRPDNAPPRDASSPHGNFPGAEVSGGKFEPSHAYDGFLAELPDDERACLQASLAMLLGAVVRADGKFDRLERIEVDWTMNFEVPRVLGDAFRFSPAADRELRELFEGPDRYPRGFEQRLRELAPIVAKLPPQLRARYVEFVKRVCREAAEASGGFLWFGSKVGPEEKQVLDRIADVLALT